MQLFDYLTEDLTGPLSRLNLGADSVGPAQRDDYYYSNRGEDDHPGGACHYQFDQGRATLLTHGDPSH